MLETQCCFSKNLLVIKAKILFIRGNKDSAVAELTPPLLMITPIDFRQLVKSHIQPSRTDPGF